MPLAVISQEVAGFVPERSLLHGLYAAHPEAFDGPWDPSEFGLGQSTSEDAVAVKFPLGLIDCGGLYVVRTETWVRTLPWLVAEVQRRKGRNCTWHGGCASLVDVPEGPWALWVDDDGSEHVVPRP